MRLIALLALALPADALAATFSVGATGDFSPSATPAATIADAIVAAAADVDGEDVIEIGDGTFDEQIDVSNVDLVFRGVPTSGDTTLTFTGGGTVGVIKVGGTADVLFDNLTLTTGNGQRCAVVRNTASATFDTVTFDDCQDTGGGGSLRVNVAAAATLIDADFVSTSPPLSDTDAQGGHVYVLGTLDITRGSFVGGQAVQGGAIYVANGAELTVSSTALAPTSFRLNDAVADGALVAAGGAIFAAGGTLDLTGASFTDNTSTALGGHVAMSAGDLVDQDGVYDGGAATTGGAVYLAQDATGDFDTTSFTDNTATTGVGPSPAGGAVAIVGASPVLFTSSSFSGNTATADGGHVHAQATSGNPVDLQILSSILADGSAENGGAVAVEADVTLIVDSSDFSGHTASTDGGAVIGTEAEVELTDVSFSGESASGDGGAVRWTGDALLTLTIDIATVTGGDAENGGAISMQGPGYASVDRATIEGAVARRGGAIDATGLTTLIVVRSDLCGNAVTGVTGGEGVGGALWVDDSTVNLGWLRIVDNTATVDGAAAWLGNSTAWLQYDSIVGNGLVGAPAGAAAVAVDATTVEVTSTLISHTTGGWGASLPADATLAYNGWYTNASGDLTGLAKGTGAVAGDPLLASWDGDGSCADDQLWPTWDSPLRDAGDPGQSDPDGSRSDIGAYGGPGAAGTGGWIIDGDGDGDFLLSDCDDTNSAIKSSAIELVADLVDQNCDGDELCYLDNDFDHYGSTSTGTFTNLDCDATVGASHVSTDCDDTDITEKPGVQWYSDGDLDGWGGASSATCARAAPTDITTPGDCDDTEDTTWPGAPETPADGVDSDCDSKEDCYADSDLDGFGDPAVLIAVTSLTCVPPGVVTNDDDCDDDDGSEFPGRTWYPDEDSDTYGDENAIGQACERAAGDHTLDHTDCNDGVFAIRPNATEVAADGVDQNCDDLETCYVDLDGDGFGSTSTTSTANLLCSSAGQSTLATDCDDDSTDDTLANQAALQFPGSTHYRDADGDSYGTAGTTRTACLITTGWSVTPGDCDDTSGGDTIAQQAALVYPGATYYPDDDGDQYGSTAGASSNPAICTLPAGWSVTAGDCDDDATDDTTAEQAALVFPGATHYQDRDGDQHGDPALPLAVTCGLPGGYSVLADDCDDDASDDTVAVQAALQFPGSVHYEDTDGDLYGVASSTRVECSVSAGWSVTAGDCDDDASDDTIADQAALEFPGGTYYRDDDGDQYGRSAVSQSSLAVCTIPAGWSVTPSDCDDDATDDTTADQAHLVFPGATHYRDRDGDQHGDASLPQVTACALSVGYSVLSDDCDDDEDDDTIDDQAALVFPGAGYWSDADGDGWGSGSPIIATCALPAGQSVVNGDCVDDPAVTTFGAESPLIHPGATYFRDDDADGYGRTSSPSTPGVCGLPAGYATHDADCDDDPTDDTVGADAASIHPGATYFQDNDGDGYGRTTSTVSPGLCGLPAGYATLGEDCDDQSGDDTPARVASLVFPGATYFPDADGDDVGRTADAFSNPTVCEPPTGFVVVGGDCDDDDSDDTGPDQAALVFPAATYYADDDADGYGDPGQSVTPGVCGLPAGHSVLDTDCDDDSSDDTTADVAALVKPGATYFEDRDADGFGDPARSSTPAVCGLPVGWSVDDRDCDDDATDDTVADQAALVFPGSTYSPDDDGDGYGRTEDAVAGSCVLPAGWSVTHGDCDDDASDDALPVQAADQIHPGAPYYPDDDSDGYGRTAQVATDPAVCVLPAGWVVTPGDCDDDATDDTTAAPAAGIHPDATYFRDVDGDSHGDAADPTTPLICGLPGGYVVLGDDCDDDPSDDAAPVQTADQVYPGASYYPDGDGDGFGRTADMVSGACALPAGHVVSPDDCDDDATDDTPPTQAALVHPGASYYPDDDGDDYGRTADGAVHPDCTLPAGWSVILGDCDDDPTDDTTADVAALIHPAATYFLDADADGFGRATSPVTPTLCGLPAGHSVTDDDCDDDATDDTPDDQAALIFPGASYYPDTDTDGFGRTVDGVAYAGCDRPAGWSVQDADCDDDPSDDTTADVASAIFPGATHYQDRDADGYGDASLPLPSASCGLPDGASVRSDDCDDDSADDVTRDVAALVFPGATYYADTDQDGWGDPGAGSVFTSCVLPGSHSVDPGDCKDTNAAVNPDASEVIGNGLDDDCDGLNPCWLDLDGDTYGGFVSGTVEDDGDEACDDAGESPTRDDCDDDAANDGRRVAAEIHPTASETCGDGIDSNCSCFYGSDDPRDPAGLSQPDSAGMVGCGQFVIDGFTLEDGDEDGDGLTWLDETGDPTDPADLGLRSSDCDLDSDDDGVDDTTEAALGMGLHTSDSDADGIDDATELGDSGSPHNHDGDGLIDPIDPDDDNDGIPTATEGDGDFDCEDPAANQYQVVGDGLPNHLDDDSDNDGLPDSVEGTADSDGDGLEDYLDCEVGGRNGDTDCDNLIRGVETDLVGGPTDADDPDSDGDGVDDRMEVGDPDSPTDHDLDGVLDALDDDDDGDGIPTLVELGLLCHRGDSLEMLPEPRVIEGRCNQAIVWEDWERLYTCGDTTTPTPVNTDVLVAGSPVPLFPDTVPDYLDPDDDGDGVPTLDEALMDPSTGAWLDSDGDDVPDYLDPDDLDGPEADRDGDGLTLLEELELGSDPDVADTDADGLLDGEETGDTDGDDIPDVLDDDDDGDGLSTATEGAGDPDGDGIPNHQDDDSDGDGILDADEGEGDEDCDGMPAWLDPDDTDGPCGAGPGGGTEILIEDPKPPGCDGCANTGGSSGWLAWVALLGLARRRRSAVDGA